MASYPPPPPPPSYDPRAQRQYYRDQARARRAAFRAQRQQMRYQWHLHRRGSVLGPLLLIAVGVLFWMTENNHISYVSFTQWYGRWWPLMLVAAGVVLLAEWTFDQHQMRDPERAPYRRSIGGGVFLLLVIGIVGMTAQEASKHFVDGGRFELGGWHFDENDFDALTGDKHESDQAIDLALAPGGAVSVVNPHGDITVNGTSDDGRVHIAVHKQVYAQSDSDAVSKAQQLTPNATYNGTALTITEPSQEGARTDLILTVPAAVPTSVNANHGDVHVASIKAPVTVTANHGEIDLSAITGLATVRINNNGSSISAHSLGGGIAIEGHGQEVTLIDIVGPVTIWGDFFGTTHMEHINGTIHFHTSRAEMQAVRLDGVAEIGRPADLTVDRAVGPFVMTTKNHNVKLDRIAGDISVSDHNGKVELTAAPPLSNINIVDSNGSVNLVLPEHAGFSVQANTTNGEIETGLPISILGGENHRSLNGVVGAGGPTVRITTTNGDISIHKDAVQPLPTNPPAPPKLTLAPVPVHNAHAGKTNNDE
jgi:DUF4097 and DUF4098 domain-containing protein YvlB